MWRLLWLTAAVLGACHAGGVRGFRDEGRDAAADAGDTDSTSRDAWMEDRIPERGVLDGFPWRGDILGTWYDCIGALTIEEDGFQYMGLDGACTTTGTYRYENFLLDLDVVETTCPTDPTNRMADFWHHGILVLPTETRMVWSYPALDTGQKVWLKGGAYRGERWVLQSIDQSRGQDLRLCFDQNGRLEAGYYFRIPDTIGLLSDSGRVDKIIETPGKLGEVQVRTTCQGYCLCVGIVVLDQTKTPWSGQAFHANCGGLDPAPIPVTGRAEPWSGYLEPH